MQVMLIPGVDMLHVLPITCPRSLEVDPWVDLGCSGQLREGKREEMERSIRSRFKFFCLFIRS